MRNQLSSRYFLNTVSFALEPFAFCNSRICSTIVSPPLLVVTGFEVVNRLDYRINRYCRRNIINNIIHTFVCHWTFIKCALPNRCCIYSIHLFLSGHCHGGQIRVCGRGIFAPGQGLFPRYHHGVYEGRLVVSAGCSNTASIPRWGNEPEVVVVRFVAD